jgi:hypothetical protein
VLAAWLAIMWHPGKPFGWMIMGELMSEPHVERTPTAGAELAPELAVDAWNKCTRRVDVS